MGKMKSYHYDRDSLKYEDSVFNKYIKKVLSKNPIEDIDPIYLKTVN